jgi:hypothetical protein
VRVDSLAPHRSRRASASAGESTFDGTLIGTFVSIAGLQRSANALARGDRTGVSMTWIPSFGAEHLVEADGELWRAGP